MSVWLSAAVGDVQVRAVTDVDGTRESTSSRVFLVESSTPAGTCEPSSERRCLQDSRYAVAVGSNDGEGTPTLEIAYFAPGAELSFATGANGSAQPVPHLTNLCAAGALGYMGALAFGDGAANGCPCYSEAGDGVDRLRAVAASDDTDAVQTDPVVVDLSITGPSDNRVDMVFVGEEYAEDEMATFAADVDRIRGSLFNLSPFREYRDYFNVRRIDLAADHAPLAATHARQRAALEHLAPDQHEILMLVGKGFGGKGRCRR